MNSSHCPPTGAILRSCLCVGWAVWGVAAPVEAADIFVRDVAEFDAGLKLAQPGDTLILADGEWRDADLRLRGVGKASAPIVLRAQTPGKVVLTGKSRLRIGGEYLVARDLLWRDTAAQDGTVSFRLDSKSLAAHCRLEQCAILGDLPDQERKWVSVYGVDNVVERCRFEGKQSRGTLLVVWLPAEAPQHHVRGNFFGPRARLGKNGGEIIRVGDSDTSLQKALCDVSQNYFYRCDGEAEIISNKSCGNMYTANAFVGCSGALTLRHGNDCFVAFNFFYGDDRKGTGGVRVIGEGHEVNGNWFVGLTGDDTRAALCLMNGLVDSPPNGYFQVRRALVKANRFLDCKETFVVGNADEDQQRQTLAPDQCELIDNRVVAARPVFVVRTPPTHFHCVDNSYAAGELGLADSAGWRKADRAELGLDDGAKRPEKFGGAPGRGAFPSPKSTGPDWLSPGDEFLPQMLQSKVASATRDSAR